MFVHPQTVFNERGVHYVFNHMDIEIRYHDGTGEDWDGSRLMSAKVTPRRYENLLLFMILIILGPSLEAAVLLLSTISCKSDTCTWSRLH